MKLKDESRTLEQMTSKDTSVVLRPEIHRRARSVEHIGESDKIPYARSGPSVLEEVTVRRRVEAPREHDLLHLEHVPHIVWPLGGEPCHVRIPGRLPVEVLAEGRIVQCQSCVLVVCIRVGRVLERLLLIVGQETSGAVVSRTMSASNIYDTSTDR